MRYMGMGMGMGAYPGLQEWTLAWDSMVLIKNVKYINFELKSFSSVLVLLPDAPW